MNADHTRRYSDDEVAQILDRALHTKTEQVGVDRHGLTLAELRDVAAEAGIDPEAVSLAAAELDRPAVPVSIPRANPPEKAGFITGTPTKISDVSVVPGHVPMERLPELVQRVRDLFDHRGTVNNDFGAMEWVGSHPTGPRYVHIQNAENGTRVSVSANLRMGKLLYHTWGWGVGTFLTMAFIGFLDLAPAMGPVIGIGVSLLGGVIPTRFLWKRRYRAEARRLQEIAEQLEATVRATAVPAISGVDSAEKPTLPSPAGASPESE